MLTLHPPPDQSKPSWLPGFVQNIVGNIVAAGIMAVIALLFHLILSHL